MLGGVQIKSAKTLAMLRRNQFGLEIVTFDAGSARQVFLRIEFPEGVTGLSEICHDSTREIIPCVANIFNHYSDSKSGNVMDILRIPDMDSGMNTINAVSVSAICNALNDGIAKSARRPLMDELNQKKRNSRQTVNKVKLCPRVKWHEKAQNSFDSELNFLKQKGIKHILIELDSNELSKKALGALKDTRAEFDTVYVRFSQQLSLEQALKVASELEKANINRFDEPFLTQTHIDNLRVLRDNTKVKIGAGAELFHIDNFRAILWQKVADVLLMDVNFCGGVGVAQEIANEATRGSANASDSFGMYCSGSLISLAFALHLCCALGVTQPIVCDLPTQMQSENYFNECSISIKDGLASIDERQLGIGLSLDESYIKTHGRIWSP